MKKFIYIINCMIFISLLPYKEHINSNLYDVYQLNIEIEWWWNIIIYAAFLLCFILIFIYIKKVWYVAILSSIMSIIIMVILDYSKGTMLGELLNNIPPEYKILKSLVKTIIALIPAWLISSLWSDLIPRKEEIQDRKNSNKQESSKK